MVVPFPFEKLKLLPSFGTKVSMEAEPSNHGNPIPTIAHFDFKTLYLQRPSANKIRYQNEYVEVKMCLGIFHCCAVNAFATDHTCGRDRVHVHSAQGPVSLRGARVSVSLRRRQSRCTVRGFLSRCAVCTVLACLSRVMCCEKLLIVFLFFKVPGKTAQYQHFIYDYDVTFYTYISSDVTFSVSTKSRYHSLWFRRKSWFFWGLAAIRSLMIILFLLNNVSFIQSLLITHIKESSASC